ncbi:ASCH domain-containing protein [Vulcanisaeta sp. JCM 14467]
MALNPRFADEILTGLKKCEVRTFLGSIGVGDTILVYYSSPVKAVKGYFTAGNSIVVRPSELMNVLNNKCSDMPRDNLEYILTKYLRAKRRVLILNIINPVMLPRIIPLTELVKLNIKIPRSYTKIDNETCQKILTKAFNSRPSIN